MLLTQELIPIGQLAEYGAVVILALAILAMVYVAALVTRNVFRRDSVQDEVTRQLVNLSSEAIKIQTKLQEALDRNTDQYKTALNRNSDAFTTLATALDKFKVGIDTKLDQQTEAIQQLASRLEENGTLTLKQLLGTSLTIELPDGSEMTIELVEENNALKLKVSKKESTHVSSDSGIGE